MDQVERTKAEIVQALYRVGWPIRSIKALTNMTGKKIGRILRQKSPLKTRSTKRSVRRDAAGHFMPGTKPGPGRPPAIPLPPEPSFLRPDGSIDPYYLEPDESLL